MQGLSCKSWTQHLDRVVTLNSEWDGILVIFAYTYMSIERFFKIWPLPRQDGGRTRPVGVSSLLVL